MFEVTLAPGSGSSRYISAGFVPGKPERSQKERNAQPHGRLVTARKAAVVYNKEQASHGRTTNERADYEQSQILLQPAVMSESQKEQTRNERSELAISILPTGKPIKDNDEGEECESYAESMAASIDPGSPESPTGNPYRGVPLNVLARYGNDPMLPSYSYGSGAPSTPSDDGVHVDSRAGSATSDGGSEGAELSPVSPSSSQGTGPSGAGSRPPSSASEGRPPQ
jgi:hypothetical protein